MLDALCLTALTLLAASDVAPVAGGNALTLPTQRHMVRVAPPDAAPVLLLAVQQQGVQGRGLGLFRSTDEGASWSYYAPIQNDATHTDRADILVVANDLYVLYSVETPAGQQIAGSARHDVVLQRWAYQGGGSWAPDRSTLVLDSTSSATAYYRASLTVDSFGRLWVSAFLLEANLTSAVVVAVSSDDGASFSAQYLGGNMSARGGGRIDAVAGRVVVLYDQHGPGTGSRYFIRDDSAATTTWSGPHVAFSEGIYHGAAFSSLVVGGTLHLAYKDKNEVLRYRTFNGFAFSGQIVIDSRADWAMQAALTEAAGEVFLFWNHQLTSSNYDLRVRRMSDATVAIVDNRVSWKGYLSAPAHLGADAPFVVCAFGDVPTANDPGWVRSVRFARSPTSPPVEQPPADAGTPPPVEQPPPDAGTPPPTPAPTNGSLIFSDDFNRTDGTGLGTSWVVESGLWLAKGYALSDFNGENRVRTKTVSCADCRLEARVVGFGVPVTGIFVREAVSGGDRYELGITSTGALQLLRVRSGVATVLASGASGIPALNNWATVSVGVTGENPVLLSASVNGAVKLQASDSTPMRISTSGFVGLHTTKAGVAFDDLKLFSLLAPAAVDGGTPPSADAGTAVPNPGTNVDAGSPPAVVDAGSPNPPPPVMDAGASTPAADAGASTPGADAGSLSPPPATGVLFIDDFNRANGGLGPNWDAARGRWLIRSSRAISDLTGANLALAQTVRCANCRVESQLVGFGVPETALAIRAQGAPTFDRYDVNLTGSGTLVVRRWRGNVATTLGSAASGIADRTNWATLSLAVSGTAPVSLTVSVNGSAKLRVTDGSSAAIKVEGRTGMATRNAGVWFDSFKVYGAQSGSTPPPPPGP